MATELLKKRAGAQEGMNVLPTAPSPAKKPRPNEPDDGPRTASTTGTATCSDGATCIFCHKYYDNSLVRYSRCCGKMAACGSNPCKRYHRPDPKMAVTTCNNCNVVLAFAAEPGLGHLTVPPGTHNDAPASQEYSDGMGEIENGSVLLGMQCKCEEDEECYVCLPNTIDPPDAPLTLPAPEIKGLHTANQIWLKNQYRGWAWAEVGFRFTSMRADMVAFSNSVTPSIHRLFWETVKKIDPEAKITEHAPVHVSTHITYTIAHDIYKKGMRIVIWETKPMDKSLGALGQVMGFCCRVELLYELTRLGVDVEVFPGILTFPVALLHSTDLEQLENLTWTCVKAKVRMMLRTPQGRVTVVVGGDETGHFGQLVENEKLDVCLSPLV